LYEYSAIDKSKEITIDISKGIVKVELPKDSSDSDNGNDSDDRDGENVDKDNNVDNNSKNELEESTAPNMNDMDDDSIGQATINDDDIDEEYYTPEINTGIISGVALTTQGQIRIRERHWKREKVYNDELEDQLQVNSQLPPHKTVDIILYAVCKALDLQISGGIKIVDARKQDASCKKRKIPESFWMPDIFPSGWARRPKRGMMYGINIYQIIRKSSRKCLIKVQKSLHKKQVQE